MRRIFLLLILPLVSPHSLDAQRVQLPSHRMIRLPSGAISPNRGRGFSGAVLSAREDARSIMATPFLPHNVLSHQRSTSSLSVSATIIDHQKLDALILSQQVNRPKVAPVSKQQRRIDQMRHQIISEAAARKTSTTAADFGEPNDQTSEEALELIRRGEENLSRGQTGVARIFFRTAFRHSRGSVKRLASRRLLELEQR